MPCLMKAWLIAFQQGQRCTQMLPQLPQCCGVSVRVAHSHAFGTYAIVNRHLFCERVTQVQKDILPCLLLPCIPLVPLLVFPLSAEWSLVHGAVLLIHVKSLFASRLWCRCYSHRESVSRRLATWSNGYGSEMCHEGQPEAPQPSAKGFLLVNSATGGHTHARGCWLPRQQ
jgi:hypothetical protein